MKKTNSHNWSPFVMPTLQNDYQIPHYTIFLPMITCVRDCDWSSNNSVLTPRLLAHDVVILVASIRKHHSSQPRQADLRWCVFVPCYTGSIAIFEVTSESSTSRFANYTCRAIRPLAGKAQHSNNDTYNATMARSTHRDYYLIISCSEVTAASRVIH